MKKAIFFIIIITATNCSRQKHYVDTPIAIRQSAIMTTETSIQINQSRVDSLELVYTVGRNKTKFNLPIDSLIKISIAPNFIDSFFNKNKIISDQVVYEKSGYEISYYHGHYIESPIFKYEVSSNVNKDQKVSYSDTKGNGSIIIIPNKVKGKFRVIGVIHIFHRTHDFDEVLLDGEKFLLTRLPAIAISLKSINDNIATLWIGHDILKNSKDKPKISGVRFSEIKLTLNNSKPEYVGNNLINGHSMKSIWIDKSEYSYISIDADRYENGSFTILSHSQNLYKLTGVYSYLGRLFKINHRISIGQEIGIKESVANI